MSGSTAAADDTQEPAEADGGALQEYEQLALANGFTGGLASASTRAAFPRCWVGLNDEGKQAIDVSLTEAINAHGRERTMLRCKAGNLGNVRRAMAGVQPGLDVLWAVLSVSASIPPSSVDEVDGADIGRLHSVLDFLLPGLLR